MTKVLVVDDSPTQRANLIRIAESQGFETILAENGKEAVAVSEAEQPDLILMDIVMPELNGFQACRKISRNPKTKTIPVILVSTKNQETDRLWGERQGAKGFFVKPPDEAALIAKMNELLAETSTS